MMDKQKMIMMTENNLKDALNNIDAFKKERYDTDLTKLIERINNMETILLQIKDVLI